MGKPGRAASAKQQIIELFEAGVKPSLIVRRLNLPEVRVNYHLAMAGLVGEPKPGDDQIEALGLQGLTAEKIAKIVGLAPNTVRRRLAVIAGHRERQSAPPK